MERNRAHCEEKEPALEKFLSRFRFQKIAKHIPEGAALLDLGCGFSGSLLKNVEKRISRGVGLDISVENNPYNSKLELREYDLNCPLPFSDNEFDIVASLANLEHLENPEQSLEEICRVLKPGGKLLLTSPSTYGKPVLEFLAFLGLVSRREIEDHKNYFNKKNLTNLGRKAGFSFVRHSYFQLGMNNFLIAVK